MKSAAGRLTEFLPGAAFEEAERRILRVGETGEPEYTQLYTPTGKTICAEQVLHAV